MLIERDKSCLLVVDVQEKLAPAVSDPADVVRNAGILMRAAARLGIPLVVSEQYPQGLGATVPELRALAPESARIAKLSFSCADDPALRQRIGEAQRSLIVIVGMEAHVCVLQSALGLQQAGYKAVVVADAIASRAPANRDAALQRLRENGVEVATTEMVLFEWLGQAGTPEFKELSKLIK
ncbi:MAG TPA: hydrolase [Candidatus Angelobacter sp.]|nr:hydrolase [Candidatus Angelobacter sp.]